MHLLFHFGGKNMEFLYFICVFFPISNGRSTCKMFLTELVSPGNPPSLVLPLVMSDQHDSTLIYRSFI